MKTSSGYLPRVNRAIHKVLLLSVCYVMYLSAPVLGQTTVTNTLYFSDPGLNLDRVDPVSTADATTAQSAMVTPSAQYLYALRGASRTDFSRYNIASNSWSSMASTPQTVTRGGALTTDGTLIYAFRGQTMDFWKYTPGTNSWASLANAPGTVSGGAALVYVNGAVYAFRGGANITFWKYTIATNSWSVMANTPAPVNWGGSLTTDGTNIYALQGNSTTAFWRYNIASNTWTVRAATPAAVGAGGSLSFDGTSIYAMQGNNANSFYRYNIATNAWISLANTPAQVNRGGALVYDNGYNYALRGNSANNFWRYDGASWNSLNNAPANVDSGGALIKLGVVGKSTIFTQAIKPCSPVSVKPGTITVSAYITVVNGTMPANPAITAALKYNASTIITLSNPVYNSGTGLLTWTGTLGSTVNVPAVQAFSVTITTSQPGVIYMIDYDSQTKPSKVTFPISTYVNVNSITVYDAPYPGGNIVTSGAAGNTYYIRTVVSDPFGFADITGLNVVLTPAGAVSAATSVATSVCTRTYESVWTTSAAATGAYTITSTATSGYENTISNSRNAIFAFCVDCPPTANTDRATVAGGESTTIDVLANDFDPNNNLDPSTLTITGQPANGSVIFDDDKMVYIPNGTFDGLDTVYYEVCDLSTPTPLCGTGMVVLTVTPVVFDACGDAGKSKIYYMPYAEDEAITSLKKSSAVGFPSNNIRTIISLKVSYPGMTLIWDHWEDGYESNILNPAQATTQVWGDGNIYNGIAPGYPTDVIPAGGSMVLDNTMLTPRAAASIFYDGKDKLYSSGQIAVTQVCGEPSLIAVQCMKTNVAAYPTEYGKSFTLPVGTDLPSRDFAYTALFIRAAQNNTTVSIDRDNDGSYALSFVMNEGEVRMVDEATPPAGAGFIAGATIISDKPIAVDAHFSGIDNYSSREVPIFPATWYSNVYYTPVPTVGPATSPHDSAAVMLYNNLNRDIDINWSSGIPSSGTFTIAAKSSERFAMPLTGTGAYRFENPTGESFVAIEIADSYTPVTEANDGDSRDWAFNLIAEERLTDFASVAWAPGSTNGTRNDNPIWITPTANTIVYVKYDGDILNGATTSPCGLKYDVAIPVNLLNYIKIKDPNDGDQSGIAVYTCNGAKIAAVYGEDASTAVLGNPSWDVGTTMQPACKQKLIIANNDYAVTVTNTPVTIRILRNDRGFMAIIDAATVTTNGLLQPAHGTVIVNANGTVIYTPNPGYNGLDTFQYNVCSTPSPIVCATATVFVTISGCPTPVNENIITGQVYLDKNQDGVKNDGGTGFTPAKILLYTDGDCDGNIDPNELTDSVYVDGTGGYQFSKMPEKIIADNFDLVPSGNSCSSGSDGSAPWRTNWTDVGDASSGFCVAPYQGGNSTDVEILQDGAFGYALAMDDAVKSAIRQINIQGASKAFLNFSFRRSTGSFRFGEDLLVQLSNDGASYSTLYTVSGNNSADPAYINVSNIDMSAFAVNNRTYLRFITNSNVDEGDVVYIDNISIKYLQYPQCYVVRLDPASLPRFATLNTPNDWDLSFASSSTCLGPYDFGVKRISTYSINDENSTWENVDVSGVVKINDFDQEGNVQTIQRFLNPATLNNLPSGSVVQGTDKTGATVINAGQLSYTGSGSFVFNPSAGFTGTVSIPYAICDNGSTRACDTAFLVITVDPLPGNGNSVIANNDEDISYGAAITHNLLGNDRDPKYLSFSVTEFSYDSNGDRVPDIATLPGTVTVAGFDINNRMVPNAGTLAINASGTYTFTPAAGFVGSIDATYTITNIAGDEATASLHIDVLADANGIQNDPPFAGDDFNYTITNKPVTGNIISNDMDPNSNPLSYAGTTLVNGGPATVIGAPVSTTQGGSVQFYANGTYLYTPPLGYVGPDMVTYTICDVTATTPQPLCANATLHFLIAPGIIITGKVWDDADGDVVDAGASEPETNAGGTLWVHLVDALGYVVAVTQVAANGVYTFSDVTPGTNYSIVLSTTQGVVAAAAPPAALPAGWVNTGETRNGTIDDGIVGVIDNRLYGYSNASNFDFGIEQMPITTPIYASIAEPAEGDFLTLDGNGSNPPPPAGTDPEDCPSGCVMNGHTIVIDSIPNNANLYYNGDPVAPGQLITDFDPGLLQIEFTAVTIGAKLTEFYYSYVDSAGVKDPAPAIYSINWLSILPATGLQLTATRDGNLIQLNWKTISEINSDYFELERSIDGRSYEKVGPDVKAAGTSNAEKTYQLTDDGRGIQSPIVYYRVNLKDKLGKRAYSNVAAVKLPENGAVIRVSPNPFISEITINAALEQPATFGIRMMDMSGRTISNNTQKITKEAPVVTLRYLNKLTPGIYLLEITDQQSGKKKVFKLEKAN